MTFSIKKSKFYNNYYIIITNNEITYLRMIGYHNRSDLVDYLTLKQFIKILK